MGDRETPRTRLTSEKVVSKQKPRAVRRLHLQLSLIELYVSSLSGYIDPLLDVLWPRASISVDIGVDYVTIICLLREIVFV